MYVNNIAGFFLEMVLYDIIRLFPCLNWLIMVYWCHMSLFGSTLDRVMTWLIFWSTIGGVKIFSGDFDEFKMNIIDNWVKF